MYYLVNSLLNLFSAVGVALGSGDGSVTIIIFDFCGEVKNEVDVGLI